VEQSFQNVRSQFRSEGDFVNQLRQAGFASPEEWRRYLRGEQRRAIMRQRLVELLRQQGLLRPLPPSDSAMRAFFEESKAQLPKRPPLISFRQIVFDVRPGLLEDIRARRLADSLATALRSGADFATLARNFSNDSASATAGGQLGWFRRGVMVPEFEDVAFGLRPGQISDPVKTPFGYHVIEVERVQPAEVLARHILITPRITGERIEEARRLADSIHAALASGAAFDDLARRFSDPGEPKLVDGVQASQLEAGYPEHLTADTTLGFLPPFMIREGTSRPRLVIAEVLRRQPPGDFEFEDIKPRIRDRLAQEQALQHYIDRLRRDTYVDIRL
jgi:peptidyl-prolyl cis-trans isomerase SurA